MQTCRASSLNITQEGDQWRNKLKTSLLLKRVAAGCLFLIVLAGCLAATPQSAAPETPTPAPTSCDEVEGNCLELSFDGESCVYKGPSDLKTGSATLLFLNESDQGAAVGFLKHYMDKRIQDAIDYFGEGPSTRATPGWTLKLNVPGNVPPGQPETWNGVLEPGTYSMICGNWDPHMLWFGGGVTVTE